jgi:Fe2+ transport system protein FeoA
MSKENFSLKDVNKNKEYVITSIDLDKDICAYYEQLGIFPGTKISCLTKAPFGGPVTLECRGAKIAIRSHIASSIFVDTQ